MEELKLDLIKLNECIYFDNNHYLRDKCSNENLLREVIKKFEDRIDSLTARAVELNSEKIFLYGNIGNLYRIVGKTNLAIESLQIAITLGESKQINNVIRLGEALKYDGQHEQALNKFDEAIELCVNNTTFLDFAFQHKGKCLLELGQTSLAADYFRKAMQIRLIKGDQSLIDSTQKAIDFTYL
ncbi:hypothetical protein [Psychrobacillus sp. NPDC093180]|uniref:hypothetical protein n=1 Tax=Psychrobacillus sp. NPDC093180 TaxID=3364489 RepID=UPI00381F05AF